MSMWVFSLLIVDVGWCWFLAAESIRVFGRLQMASSGGMLSIENPLGQVYHEGDTLEQIAERFFLSSHEFLFNVLDDEGNVIGEVAGPLVPIDLEPFSYDGSWYMRSDGFIEACDTEQLAVLGEFISVLWQPSSNKSYFIQTEDEFMHILGISSEYFDRFAIWFLPWTSSYILEYLTEEQKEAILDQLVVADNPRDGVSSEEYRRICYLLNAEDTPIPYTSMLAKDSNSSSWSDVDDELDRLRSKYLAIPNISRVQPVVQGQLTVSSETKEKVRKQQAKINKQLKSRMCGEKVEEMRVRVLSQQRPKSKETGKGMDKTKTKTKIEKMRENVPSQQKTMAKAKTDTRTNSKTNAPELKNKTTDYQHSALPTSFVMLMLSCNY